MCVDVHKCLLNLFREHILYLPSIRKKLGEMCQFLLVSEIVMKGQNFIDISHNLTDFPKVPNAKKPIYSS